jgi:hypothetical protein
MVSVYPVGTSMKNILSFLVPAVQPVPCTFKALLVMLIRGLETCDKSVACVQDVALE